LAFTALVGLGLEDCGSGLPAASACDSRRVAPVALARRTF
jgi:hypothetical protein